jgi:hypothetical protein
MIEAEFMKRITFWLLAISLTFILGVAATFIYFKFFYINPQEDEMLPEVALPESENNQAEMPDLTFCELVNNPEKYDGKTVRLRAKMSIGTEGSWFSDNACGANNAAFISEANDEVSKAIDKARDRGKREPWDFEVNLIVVGKFKNVVYSDRCCLTTPFQFEILKVEKASKVK